MSEHEPGTLWSLETFERTAQTIIDKFGCIPTQTFLNAKGYGGFERAIRKYGPTIADVRKRFNVHNVTLTSIDGSTWLSFPEVNTANMLLIRGYNVEKGRQYPVEYSQKYSRDHALYDMHFVATSGIYENVEISVEIWGGPTGVNKTHKAFDYYAETRGFKEDFHKNCDTFLGIEFTDCYKDAKLLDKLRPFIGDAAVLPKYLAQLPPVAVVALPLYDQVIKECKDVLQKLGTSELPPVSWFKRDEAYRHRKVFDWEPASWSGFAHRLALVKISVVRKTLGNEVRVTWSTEKLVDEMVKWFQHHDMSPAGTYVRISKLKTPTSADLELLTQARSLANAVHKRGTSSVMAIVKQKLAAAPAAHPVEATRQRQGWTVEKLVGALVDWYREHDDNPGVVMRRLKKLSTPTPSEKQLKSHASALVNAINRRFPQRLNELMDLVTKEQELQSAEIK